MRIKVHLGLQFLRFSAMTLLTALRIGITSSESIFSTFHAMSQIASSNISLDAALPIGGEDTTANIVDWDGPSDIAARINWSRSKRWAHIIIVAVLGLVP